jgi:hypothetical protein
MIHEWLTVVFEKGGQKILRLHSQVDHFFFEKCDERCCKHSLETSLHQIPLIEMKKDLDHHLEKRASA